VQTTVTEIYNMILCETVTYLHYIPFNS